MAFLTIGFGAWLLQKVWGLTAAGWRKYDHIEQRAGEQMRPDCAAAGTTWEERPRPRECQGSQHSGNTLSQELAACAVRACLMCPVDVSECACVCLCVRTCVSVCAHTLWRNLLAQLPRVGRCACQCECVCACMLRRADARAHMWGRSLFETCAKGADAACVSLVPQGYVPKLLPKPLDWSAPPYVGGINHPLKPPSGGT